MPGTNKYAVGKLDMRFGSLICTSQVMIATAICVMLPLQVLSATDNVDACPSGSELAALPEDTIKVMTLNIAHGRNSAVNQLFVSKRHTFRNLDYIAALLADIAPNVVALQEADGRSRWSGNFDHVTYIAEKSDLPCVVHGLHSKSWISNYGTALLSRGKAIESSSVSFSPSWPSKQKGFVTTTIDWSVDQQRIPVTLVSVHFDFLRKKVRDRQVSETVAQLVDIDGPLVLMGDLNSHWDQKSSHVRSLVDALDLQAFSPEKNGLGTYKGTTGKRLDWILISQELAFEAYEVLPDIVADHLAVVAEISYRGSPDPEHLEREGPPLRTDERSEVIPTAR